MNFLLCYNNTLNSTVNKTLDLLDDNHYLKKKKVNI